jgi:thiamine pyrophosphate-dependent acetolactate synthase large subunit-like protein
VTEGQPRLDRREVIAAILLNRAEAVVVTGLGSPTYDVAAAGDNPLNFHLWGAMGGAAMVGLGIALAQPQRRVLVVTGDGEMLMGLGSLATVSVSHPQNLSIIAIDNEFYAETGMQPSHTGSGVDLAGIARAANIPFTATINSREELEAWIPRIYGEHGTVFVAVKVAPSRPPASLSPQDGAESHHRFRVAVSRNNSHALEKNSV